MEKTDRLLLGWVKKDDILVALSFHWDAPGEDAPVIFVWGEMGIGAAGEWSAHKGKGLAQDGVPVIQHHGVKA